MANLMQKSAPSSKKNLILSTLQNISLRFGVKKFLVSLRTPLSVILWCGKPTSAIYLLKLALNAAALNLSLPYSFQKVTQVKTSSIPFVRIAAKQDMRRGVPVTVTKELYRVVTKMKGELYGTTKMY